MRDVLFAAVKDDKIFLLVDEQTYLLQIKPLQGG